MAKPEGLVAEFPQRRIPTISEAQAKKRWQDLTETMQRWFHKPDIQAWEIVLATAVSHYFKRDQPVWLMLLGPAGSMKTTLLKLVESLDEAVELDSLTPQTLLSGFQRGNSFLHRIGTHEDRSAIFLLPDFSTIISMRDGPRQEIASQFRKLYDGKLTKPVGTGQTLEWKGKITMIVAATPAAERSWGMMRDIGERFMTTRWPRGEGIQQARMAHQQIGHEEEINERMCRETRTFVDLVAMRKQIMGGEICQTPLEVIENGIAPFANAIAILRGHVVRSNDWRREIEDVPEPEGPTRIMKALSQVARAHGAMFRIPKIGPRQMAIVKRLGMDTVPPVRKMILDQSLASDDGIGWATLVRATGLPPTTVTRATEDMVALRILEVQERVEKTYLVTEEFQELLSQAAPVLNLG